MIMDISIITPSYNRKKFLVQLYNNLSPFILKYNFEWIVCLENDDIESINYLETIKSEKIRYIAGNFTNGATAFSNGLKIARGQFINYHGDDDLKTENFFSILENIELEYDFIHSRCEYTNGTKCIRILSSYIKRFFLKNFSYTYLKLVNFIMTPALIIRKDFFKSINGLDPKYKFANDYKAWLQILNEGKFIYIYLLSTKAFYSTSTATGSFQFSRIIELSKISLEYNKKNIMMLAIAYFFLFLIFLFNLTKLFKFKNFFIKRF